MNKTTILNIIKEERKNRLHRIFKEAMEWFVIIILSFIGIFLIILSFMSILQDLKEIQYEYSCDIKFEGIMFGEEYLFNNCYVLESNEYYTCHCSYIDKEGYNFNNFDIQKELKR